MGCYVFIYYAQCLLPENYKNNGKLFHCVF